MDVFDHDLIFGMKNPTITLTVPNKSSTHLKMTSEKAPVTKVPILSFKISMTQL